MLLIDENLKCVYFKNEKLRKLFFVRRYKNVNKGRSDEIFAKLKGCHYVKSGSLLS
jgi:hypothetical protein